MSLYEILGIKKDATEHEIKSAFRAKAKELRPDLIDSDTREEWDEVIKAYTILNNSDKRERYDRTGNTSFEDEKAKIKAESFANLSIIFNQLISKHEEVIQTFNIIKASMSIARTAEQETAKRILALRKEIKVLKGGFDRVIHKDDKTPDLLSSAFGQIIYGYEEDLKKYERDLLVLANVKQLIANYKYHYKGVLQLGTRIGIKV